MHFVSSKYSNISEALIKKDGLAVLGVFIEVTFYSKWFFRQDEGSSRLHKFNWEQFFFATCPLWIFSLGVNHCYSKHLHSKFFRLLELRWTWTEGYHSQMKYRCRIYCCVIQSQVQLFYPCAVCVSFSYNNDISRKLRCLEQENFDSTVDLRWLDVCGSYFPLFIYVFIYCAYHAENRKSRKI